MITVLPGEVSGQLKLPRVISVVRCAVHLAVKKKSTHNQISRHLLDHSLLEAFINMN